MKIQKKNLSGEVVFQYDGEVVRREENAIVLEAFFGRDDMSFMNVMSSRPKNASKTIAFSSRLITSPSY